MSITKRLRRFVYFRYWAYRMRLPRYRYLMVVALLHVRRVIPCLQRRTTMPLTLHDPENATCTGCNQPNIDYTDDHGRPWHRGCHREFVTEYTRHLDREDRIARALQALHACRNCLDVVQFELDPEAKYHDNDPIPGLTKK